MELLLFRTGLILFLLGLLTGFAIPALKNPRMGLSSHLEATSNGVFLIVLGLLWPHLDLSHGWALTAAYLLIYAAYANWLATLLAGVWGAGRKLAPIATGEHRASAAKESVVSVLLITLAVTIVFGVGIVLVGLF